MADKVFTYKGVEWSSKLPDIGTGDEKMSRADFQKKRIDETIARMPMPKDGEKPVYVATGGGYGSFDRLVEHEVKTGKLPAGFKAIKGDDYREDPLIVEERAELRKAIREHLGEKATEKDIDRIYSAFYSDEVNTQIGKKAVTASFTHGNSVGYESASLKPDTEERAQAAQKAGYKTVLLAGDKELAEAIKSLPHIEPANTANSHKLFAARLKELSKSFDEVRLYNTDKNPPELLAEKKAGGELETVKGKEMEFMKFLLKAELDPAKVASDYAKANTLTEENKRDALDKMRKDQSMQGAGGVPTNRSTMHR